MSFVLSLASLTLHPALPSSVYLSPWAAPLGGSLCSQVSLWCHVRHFAGKKRRRRKWRRKEKEMEEEEEEREGGQEKEEDKEVGWEMLDIAC